MKFPLWAVYKKTTKKAPEGMNAVCTQEEWNAMELAKPGQQPLIQGSIANEGMAERLARGTSGASAERRGGGGPRAPAAGGGAPGPGGGRGGHPEPPDPR